MIELIFALILPAGLCFVFGVIYPAVMVIGYKLMGGKKPIRDYIKSL